MQQPRFGDGLFTEPRARDGKVNAPARHHADVAGVHQPAEALARRVSDGPSQPRVPATEAGQEQVLCLELPLLGGE